MNVFSPTWEPADSYGRLARELANGLPGHVNRYGPHAPTGAIKPEWGGFLLGYPTNYPSYGVLARGGVRVAITMFESTILPEGWVENLNKCHAVIVPAHGVADVFRTNGVRVPIHVIKLGVSEAFMTYRQRPADGPFTFLAITDRRDNRKSWFESVIVFTNAFGKDTSYRLILKSRGRPININAPNIEVVTGDLSDSEMADLYARCHAMSFPSKGEGFGLPPREFAATGGVPIVTPWLGTADDLIDWGFPVRYRLDTAWSRTRPDWHGRLGLWAKPDIKSLENMMRFVARNYADLEPFRRHAHNWMLNLTWQNFASEASNVYERIANNDGNTHRSA